MKKRLLTVLSVILTFLMLGSTSAFAANVAPVQSDKFTDVSASDWYKEYVDFVASNGYMIGTSETTFEPQTNLTRAMFATILARYDKANVDDSKATIFNDVPVDQWYTGSIGWANEKEIVKGYGDGNFGTNDSITRQDLSLMIVRYIRFYEKEHNVTIKTHGGEWNGDITFTDENEIRQDEETPAAIKALVNYGVLLGYPDGTVKPTQNITRAETAAIIKRLDWILQPTPTPTPTPSGDTKYRVTATVTKDGKGPELIADYTTAQARTTTVSQIVKDLITDGNGADDNKGNIKKIIQEHFLDKARDGGPKTVNGYTITTSKDGNIHVDGVDLWANLQDEVAVYNERMVKVGTELEIQDSSTWKAFVRAFSPDKLFTKNGTDLKLKSADAYYSILSDAVDAACALYDEVATAAKYQEILDKAEAAGVKLGVQFDTFKGQYSVLGGKVTTPDTLNDAAVVEYLAADNKKVLYNLVKDGKNTVFEATENVTSAEDVVKIVNARISRNWKDRDDIQAVLKAIEDAYTGTYNVTVTVEKVTK